MQNHKVVIVGGGFGGLYAAQRLAQLPVKVTLLDRRNFHLFQPLLYQVATGTIAPGDIASPLRLILAKNKNVEVLWAEVVGFNIPKKTVILQDGAEVSFDTLIMAAGSEPNYFNHPEWKAFAPGLKTVEDATAMRSRILLAFENAEREPDPDIVRRWLTFVVVGAGPTGVELAGALAEVARKTLRGGFRHIHPGSAKIILVDADPHILMGYSEKLAAKAIKALRKLGVTVRDNIRVTDVEKEAVVLGEGSKAERIESRTILWTAGVRASPLGEALAKEAGAATDKGGRVLVNSDLSIPAHPEILVIGDLANPSAEKKQSLPGVAQVAMQEGKYVAHLIEHRLKGRPMPPFKYHDRGSLATIGRNIAVAKIGPFEFDGFLAWLVWAGVHLYQLLEFENRILVMFQWAWNYISWRRTDLLITHAPPSGRATSQSNKEGKKQK